MGHEPGRRTRLNLLVDTDTHRRLRILAARKGVSMSNLIRQGIKETLDREENRG